MSKTMLLPRRAVLGSLLAGAGAVAAPSTAEKARLPLVRKRVEKVFRAPGKAPNGLQAVADGLWVLDQVDPNKAHKVRYADGSVLKEIQTESSHGSGISFGGGALWIASTYGLKTLKVDPGTGRTLASFDTPGIRQPPPGSGQRASGAHGIEWAGDKYWIAVPPAAAIYLVEPDSGKVIRSIPAPGTRPHGIALHDSYLWCVETNDRAIYRMDTRDGRLLEKIQLAKEDPEPHGMTIRDGVFWCCDAVSGWIFRLV